MGAAMAELGFCGGALGAVLVGKSHMTGDPYTAEDLPDFQDLEVRGRPLEGGDRRYVTSLCGSCRSGLVCRRRGETDAWIVYCSWINRVVPGDIEDCSRYRNVKDMDMMEMVAIARPVDGRIGVHDHSYR